MPQEEFFRRYANLMLHVREKPLQFFGDKKPTNMNELYVEINTLVDRIRTDGFRLKELLSKAEIGFESIKNA